MTRGDKGTHHPAASTGLPAAGRAVNPARCPEGEWCLVTKRGSRSDRGCHSITPACAGGRAGRGRALWAGPAADTRLSRPTRPGALGTALRQRLALEALPSSSSQRLWGRRLCRDEPSLLHGSHGFWGSP